MRTTIDITVKQPGKAIDALSEAAPGLSRQKIKDAMTKGACWWTHKGKRLRLRRATKELKPGIRLQLYYDEKVLERKPEKPILLENAGRYTVWFKPHGLLAQGSQWGDHCSLLRLAEIQLEQPCHLIHRLDADAAGLMLIAHDSKAAGALSQCFSGRTMTKPGKLRWWKSVSKPDENTRFAGIWRASAIRSSVIAFTGDRPAHPCSFSPFSWNSTAP